MYKADTIDSRSITSISTHLSTQNSKSLADQIKYGQNLKNKETKVVGILANSNENNSTIGTQNNTTLGRSNTNPSVTFKEPSELEFRQAALNNSYYSSNENLQQKGNSIEIKTSHFKIIRMVYLKYKGDTDNEIKALRKKVESQIVIRQVIIFFFQFNNE